MNRNETFMEEKCSNVFIDSHVINYEGEELEFSICYDEASNRFVYQTDFLHLNMLPFEGSTSWIIRMAVQLVFEIALIIAVILPNFILIIPKIWKEPVRENFKKLFDLRMMSIYLLFLAQTPMIILGIWATVCKWKFKILIVVVFSIIY